MRSLACLPGFIRLLILLALVVSLLPPTRAARAASFTVNSLADNTTDDTFCTLREAILAANNASGYNGNCGPASNDDDTITFNIPGSGPHTITLGLTLPAIVDAATAGKLTIDGSGQNIIISGDTDNDGYGNVQVMRVNSGANLTLRNLTITKGRASGGSGGGIYNAGGTVTVTGSTFSQNSADFGGGIYNDGGTLTVTNSTFSRNSAFFYGGGIANGGTLEVTNSTFSGNSAGLSGGGIANGGTLEVTNSTFSQNSADSGGGIYNDGGTLTVTNSTFSRNSAFFYGGGIFISSGTATLKNTIIANSTAGGDCVGSLSGTNNNNLIESTGTNACGLTNGVNGNIIGFDPNLGALTGSPAYFPLNPGSPAIDKGDNTTCAAAPVNNQSQNGATRPQDGDGDSVAVCDIGSYERDIVPPTLLSFTRYNPLTSPTNAGTLVFRATFSEAVQNVDAADFSLNAAPATTAAITAVTLVSTGLYEITVSGGDLSAHTYNGIIGLDLAGGQNITDLAGNALPAGEPATDETYTVDNTPSLMTFRVNTTDDNTTDDGVCTLREAILAANNASGYNDDCGTASTGDDTITFSVSGTITLGSPLPNIVSASTAGALTIDGSGQNITISGGGSVRVMIVDSGANLTLRNLTIANGYTAGLGGGISNAGTLTVTGSTFSQNNASSHGGGIYNAGTLTVESSTFSNNSANFGGGIQSVGTLTVASSTFSKNSAVGSGGGISNGSGGTLEVANSAFSQNSVNVVGGGIYNGGTLKVFNSTFSQNSANSSGGGIYNGGTATLRNTIIANSTSGGDCVGSLSGTNNNNLIESTGTNACGLAHGSNGNIIGFDPNLGALTGSPAYFPLNLGSLAIDAGDNATCATAPVNNQSQNGVARPQDGDGNGTAVCDIGSYERPDLPPVLLSFTRHNPPTSPTNAGTLIFRATFNEAVQNVDAADFSLNAAPATTAAITAVTLVTPSLYEITVTGGNLSANTYNGVIGLNLAAGQNITDLAGNALPAGEPATDETYTIVIRLYLPLIAR